MVEKSLPKNASTVILCRPDGSRKFEVFLTRRPLEMDFLGGFYVFPGGIVEREDFSTETLSRCRGLSSEEAQKILGNQMSPELSLAHWVAAIRELFEEAGILLCATENGTEIDRENDELDKRLVEKREALVRGALSFKDFLASEQLYCQVERLIYFSHRVTPEKSPIRFDTRFYLARLPAAQNPLPFSEEVAESLWMTPDAALDEAEKGKLPLIPPTIAALRTLAGLNSWEALCAHYQLK